MKYDWVCGDVVLSPKAQELVTVKNDRVYFPVGKCKTITVQVGRSVGVGFAVIAIDEPPPAMHIDEAGTAAWKIVSEGFTFKISGFALVTAIETSNGWKRLEKEEKNEDVG